MPLTLTSPAFADGQPIPLKYTRDGENLAPPLQWTGAPETVESFILIVEDPDAPNGTFRHWAIYNIPDDWDGLPENVETGSDGAMRYGRNDFGNAHYDGPEPPKGHGVHHYHFRLGALSVPKLDIAADTDIKDLWRQAEKHLIAEARLSVPSSGDARQS
ncbi:YbhB/YbcL family Raf kinase inhibitor-like protein [Devosia sp. YIM 151766]|uniref:YbhB/YbcL family Raf kinase inhibitor-like protein n=1 Tax=Devosia sp. YIM 151766 TaxID=3017325 RepID=UPI00255C7D7B|nr:YbhB/YbcL family Raf kinase inhibitor-like protein [Devosia sp. YIM 151766]WIY53575.1 YbhB/YbcL family Raf kinase inhibitor-like protein [Devosia sp. YIM 151766]